jgi:putative NADPH-quinone reductase
MTQKTLFLVASTREAGHLGNTEWLAAQAAAALPADQQQWLHLAQMQLPPFVDLRHTAGQYPMPELGKDGDMKALFDATMACEQLVFVAPVYWYSFPANLKTYLDHWSAWMRIPGVDFKGAMAKKTLRLITTSGDRAKAQPMIDSTELCAKFLGMTWGGVLWGKGGAPKAVEADAQAIESAKHFLAG